MNQQRDTIEHQQNPGAFSAIAASYSLGVFNDNLFKQAAMLLAIGAGLPHLQGTATVVFALPFILFAAYAGWLADRFPKKNVVVHAKVLEFLAIVVGALGILFTNWTCILVMLFLMGLQSAVFSPALNGAIPEYFSVKKITSVNGRLKMVTTLAILLGIVSAGFVLDMNSPVSGTVTSGQLIIAIVMIIVSLTGLLASCKLPKIKAAAPQKPFPWAGPLHSVKNLLELRRDPLLFFAIGCYAGFYFLAALVILLINSYGIDQLGLSQSVTGLLSVALMTGIALGAVFASRQRAGKCWSKSITPAASGISTGLITASLAAGLPGNSSIFLLLCSFALVGCSGGSFLIPTTSFIQTRPQEQDKGQVLAVVGFCSFCGILLAGQLYAMAEKSLQPAPMLLTTGLSILVLTLLYLLACTFRKSSADSCVHLFLRALLKLRYNIKTVGLDDIDESTKGRGILFLANHPAWIDPVVMMTTLSRKFQPRPLADYDQTNAPYIRPLMKLVKAIRIRKQNGRGARAEIIRALNLIKSSLQQGDNVLLYPSGQLYRSKREKIGGKSAVHTIMSAHPDQRVVLARTTGLWGSSFSWANGAPSLKKNWKDGLAFILANCLFFGPRRSVLVEFVEPDDFPRNADRMTINRYLESFYNKRVQPNTRIPLFWWQGATPVVGEEPPLQPAHLPQQAHTVCQKGQQNDRQKY